MNVNHTVDSAEPDDGTQEAPEMKSKPNFEIDIVKSSGKTLSFSSVPPAWIVEAPPAFDEDNFAKTFENNNKNVKIEIFFIFESLSVSEPTFSRIIKIESC